MALSLTLGANGFTNPQQGAVPGFVVCGGTCSLGSSYTTGGEALAASDFHADATTIHSVIVGDSEDTLNRHVWDPTAETIIATVNATDAEVASTTDLSAAAKQFAIIAVVS